VLCGNNGEACWAKYGCYPLHRPYCHEMALRILLACIEAHANRCKRTIVPVRSNPLPTCFTPSAVQAAELKLLDTTCYKMGTPACLAQCLTCKYTLPQASCGLFLLLGA
jgi:hypothetical protein